MPEDDLELIHLTLEDALELYATIIDGTAEQAVALLRSRSALEGALARPASYAQPLLTATLTCAAVGVALPYIEPFARLFGFEALPLSFLAVLVGMIVTYLALAQIGVALFFKPQGGRSLARAIGRHERDIRRRASRWHIWPHGTPSPPRAGVGTEQRPAT